MPSRRELANAIRALSMDAVQRAKSGHPGAPMGMADIAEVLWNDALRHNPANPAWVNRDRFVLSNGHGSMLIYSLLHLSGYDLSMDDLRDFRQLHSRTPGHPEYGYTAGVETTTGPLGQGLANAVGMALAEKVLAAQFNRPGHPLVDHYTYCFVGDGCLMEGVSHEACSLAGTLGLGKLVVFYDDNGISIDGKVEGWFTDDTPKRFRAYGWHVVADVDGHDPEAVSKALAEARKVKDRPSLICCKTVIGFGAPNACGTHGVHGAPLGDDEIQATREFLHWTHPPFEVPDEIYAGWDARARGKAAEAEWQTVYAAYRKAHPEMADEFDRRMAGQLPESFGKHADELLARIVEAGEKVATRKASQNVLEGFGPYLPEMIGGSADLTGSNNTRWSAATPVTAEDGDGNYIFYGVREFAMTAIQNGMALHGGLLPYGGTFLVFSDYARNAVRMAALMKLRNILVYTHDSIGLGEDGPTHQPVEHVASLRMIPNMSLWRPCDGVETVAAWRAAVERSDGPTSLVLTRQGLPCLERTAEQLADMRKGGYILRDCAGEPALILIATGSEVPLAEAAWQRLNDEGVAVRLVSMPSTDVFDGQDTAYRESVLPAGVSRRLAVEAGLADYWYRYVGLDGDVVGMHGFGESAPAEALFEHFGFTVDNVVERARALLG
ncbi:transketolase [Natronocella acetinitrilica]|uniref:Transketolase n=1 Tax=Natronocella acetinitrilica TaxID=414046 RepID=A0AAE3G4W9_9GAMM|nr:transketolase [Natronocella acetinitrilica]MCP1675119.1 transketolase [Natronocella acetinitrilica]